MKRAVITIIPYNARTDKLIMKMNDYKLDIVGGQDKDGKLRIINPGTPAMKASEWDIAINLPAYRLDIDVRVFLIKIYLVDRLTQ